MQDRLREMSILADRDQRDRRRPARRRRRRSPAGLALQGWRSTAQARPRPARRMDQVVQNFNDSITLLRQSIFGLQQEQPSGTHRPRASPARQGQPAGAEPPALRLGRGRRADAGWRGSPITPGSPDRHGRAHAARRSSAGLACARSSATRRRHRSRARWPSRAGWGRRGRDADRHRGRAVVDRSTAAAAPIWRCSAGRQSVPAPSRPEPAPDGMSQLSWQAPLAEQFPLSGGLPPDGQAPRAARMIPRGAPSR